MRVRKTMPVREYMSHLPVEIDRRETLSAAIRRMEEHRIRHVPVMDGPKIFGILSRQDVQDARRRHGASAEARPVGDVCTRDPLMVSPLAPIPEVAGQMVGRGVTSALVVDEGLLVGIFTSVDALRLLANL
jgi:acetoin utilization protein AcuB